MLSKNEIPQVLLNLGIETLNPMQVAAEKAILKDKAVLLLAPTGSGKTLAFLLPVFQGLQPEQSKVQCLILTPTRELAIQIEQVWKKMGTGYKVNVCYGGHSMATEIQNLVQPPAVLIGTPGRIADHLSRGTFQLNEIQSLVLDEFDKSLEMGYQEQMSYIIDGLTKLKKTILVSATSGVDIPGFTRVNDPTIIDYSEHEQAQVDLTIKSVTVDEEEKVNSLFKLICSFNGEPALIFFNHREITEEVSSALNAKGLYTTFYHGGMEQDDRERALIHFRNGSIPYLLTTDLAARGLDIPEMKHVVHFQLPLKEAEFIHRNGRTARMQASGTAYILFGKKEERPEYVEESIKEQKLNPKYDLPSVPVFQTLYIGGGKKNKINKVDIVGFLSQKGKLEKGDLGLIEVKDFMSFVALRKSKVKLVLNLIKDEKMKGKKYKIEVAQMQSVTATRELEE
jgi:superfamily II DNA/RNA helicase